MKTTMSLWALLFVIAFFTAGFFPAILLTGLAAGSSVSLALREQNSGSLGSGSSYKTLH